MGVYADPSRLSSRFLADVVAAVPNERPRHPRTHHESAQILAAGPADGDGAPVSIGILRLADDRPPLYERLELGRRQSTGWPAIRTVLLSLRRVDAPQTIGHAALLDGVAVGDGLGPRRGCKAADRYNP